MVVANYPETGRRKADCVWGNDIDCVRLPVRARRRQRGAAPVLPGRAIYPEMAAVEADCEWGLLLDCLRLTSVCRRLARGCSVYGACELPPDNGRRKAGCERGNVNKFFVAFRFMPKERSVTIEWLV
jgi:hypothetical protein